MKKKITIEEILNGLPENNLFIDVELKSVKNNISLLNRIYSEGLLSKLLDGYMAAFFRQVKIGVLTLTLEKKQ